MSAPRAPVPARRPTESFVDRRRPTSKREIEEAQGRTRRPISAINAVRAKKLADELDASGAASSGGATSKPAAKSKAPPKLPPKPKNVTTRPPVAKKPPSARSSTKAPRPPVRRGSRLSTTAEELRKYGDVEAVASAIAEEGAAETPAVLVDKPAAESPARPPVKKPPTKPSVATPTAVPQSTVGADKPEASPAESSPEVEPADVEGAAQRAGEDTYAVPVDGGTDDEAADGEAAEGASEDAPPPLPCRGNKPVVTLLADEAPPRPPKRGTQPPAFGLRDPPPKPATETRPEAPVTPPPRSTLPVAAAATAAAATVVAANAATADDKTIDTSISNDGFGGADTERSMSFDVSEAELPPDTTSPTIYAPPVKPTAPRPQAYETLDGDGSDGDGSDDDGIAVGTAPTIGTYGSELDTEAPPPPPPKTPRPRAPMALPPSDPSEMGYEADNLGEVLEEDVYEPIDQLFRERTSTQKARLMSGEETLPGPKAPPPEEQIYDHIPGDLGSDDEADYSGQSVRKGTGPPPLPVPYRPQSVASSEHATAGELPSQKPEAVIRWWPGKKKASAAPQAYKKFIDAFEGPTNALMTVTATKVAVNKVYAELPFELGEVIEIIQMDDCPAGLWVGRSLASGYFGFVKISDVRVDPIQLRQVMEAAAVLRQASTTSAEGIPLGHAQAKLGIQVSGGGADTPAMPASGVRASVHGKNTVPSIRRHPRPTDLPPSVPGSTLPEEELGVYSSIPDGEDDGTTKGASAAADAPPSAEDENVYDALDDANLPEAMDIPPALPQKPKKKSYEMMAPGGLLRANHVAKAAPRERPRSAVVSVKMRPPSSVSKKSGGDDGGYDNHRLNSNVSTLSGVSSASSSSMGMSRTSMMSNPEYGDIDEEPKTEPDKQEEDLPSENLDEIYDVLEHT